MRPTARKLALAVTALALSALAAPLLLPPQPSEAQPFRTRGRAGTREAFPSSHRRDDWGRWDDFNWTILQRQREALSSQEEAAREAGRKARRDEVQQNKQKAVTEHEAYFESILQTSQAALRAPMGAYYRKPGFVSLEGPGPGAQTVKVGGVPYLYDQGIFWLQQGQQYIVVTAPSGAVVDRLPASAYPVVSDSEPFFYFFGTFFRAEGGKYAVVQPPTGITVSYVPDGYTQEKSGDATVYRFGAVSFKPIFMQGVLFYQVVER